MNAESQEQANGCRPLSTYHSVAIREEEPSLLNLGCTSFKLSAWNASFGRTTYEDIVLKRPSGRGAGCSAGRNSGTTFAA